MFWSFHEGVLYSMSRIRWSLKKYTNKDILEKFKSEAQSKSPPNEGFLIPAHFIDISFLKNLGPVTWGN